MLPSFLCTGWKKTTTFFSFVQKTGKSSRRLERLCWSGHTVPCGKRKEFSEEAHPLPYAFLYEITAFSGRLECGLFCISHHPERTSEIKHCQKRMYAEPSLCRTRRETARGRSREKKAISLPGTERQNLLPVPRFWRQREG